MERYFKGKKYSLNKWELGLIWVVILGAFALFINVLAFITLYMNDKISLLKWFATYSVFWVPCLLSLVIFLKTFNDRKEQNDKIPEWYVEIDEENGYLRINFENEPSVNIYFKDIADIRLLKNVKGDPKKNTYETKKDSFDRVFIELKDERIAVCRHVESNIEEVNTLKKRCDI